jgi:hypothetical protein
LFWVVDLVVMPPLSWPLIRDTMLSWWKLIHVLVVPACYEAVSLVRPCCTWLASWEKWITCPSNGVFIMDHPGSNWTR